MSGKPLVASARIGAPAGRVYGILADYHVHHPRIVPPETFRKIEVLQGGVGAGTRTRVTMRVMGSTQVFEHVISEPEPGRVLVEAAADGSSVTTFTVDPVDADTCTVTFSTVFARGGILGAIQRALSAAVLRPVYADELKRLDDYARQNG